MNGYARIRKPRVFGARVYIHWSALLVGAGLFLLCIRTPLLAVITIVSYFGIIFLHEAGHAGFARRMGYRPFAIYLGVIHGVCDYEEPYSHKDEAIVAWGGVAAQMMVALPLIALAATTPLASVRGLGPVVAFLGYFNLVFALLNLVPVAPLDGAKAWALIPIALAERRHKAQAARRSGKR
ncbi:hypothetical protein [Variovorax sp.]|uniref:hypothetical protein n=1 Tax=Variovorax sp. TaxID=1871043 RepID=UPI001385C029|nr:hypothetical protein [Variovorax sp.]KAF1071811.1 MAG: hypothetical protein GAK39_00964 [Variovorax sp.]